MAVRKKSRAAVSRATKRNSAGAKRKSSAAGTKRARGAAGAVKKAALSKAAPGRKAAPGKRAGARTAPRRRTAAAGTAPVRVPNAIGLRVHHMDYTTHALDEVRRFYTEVLGFASFTFDPKMSYLAVNTGASSSIGFMPPMATPPEQWQPPREPTIYLIVENVDRAHRDLVAKGVSFEQEPADMPWGHRLAVLRDPEGRMVCLAQLGADA